jgi:hypothetical protein
VADADERLALITHVNAAVEIKFHRGPSERLVGKMSLFGVELPIHLELDLRSPDFYPILGDSLEPARELPVRSGRARVLLTAETEDPKKVEAIHRGMATQIGFNADLFREFLRYYGVDWR